MGPINKLDNIYTSIINESHSAKKAGKTGRLRLAQGEQRDVLVSKDNKEGIKTCDIKETVKGVINIANEVIAQLDPIETSEIPKIKKQMNTLGNYLKRSVKTSKYYSSKFCGIGRKAQEQTNDSNSIKDTFSRFETTAQKLERRVLSSLDRLSSPEAQNTAVNIIRNTGARTILQFLARRCKNAIKNQAGGLAYFALQNIVLTSDARLSAAITGAAQGLGSAVISYNHLTSDLYARDPDNKNKIVPEQREQFVANVQSELKDNISSIKGNSKILHRVIQSQAMNLVSWGVAEGALVLDDKYRDVMSTMEDLRTSVAEKTNKLISYGKEILGTAASEAEAIQAAVSALILKYEGVKDKIAGITNPMTVINELMSKKGMLQSLRDKLTSIATLSYTNTISNKILEKMKGASDATLDISNKIKGFIYSSLMRQSYSDLLQESGVEMEEAFFDALEQEVTQEFAFNKGLIEAGLYSKRDNIEIQFSEDRNLKESEGDMLVNYICENRENILNSLRREEDAPILCYELEEQLVQMYVDAKDLDKKTILQSFSPEGEGRNYSLEEEEDTDRSFQSAQSFQDASFESVIEQSFYMDATEYPNEETFRELVRNKLS